MSLLLYHNNIRYATTAHSNHQDSDGELFSPPLQPSFPDHTVALPSMPLPDMGFKVTSRLHPKFLIAKFPLPRKKVTITTTNYIMLSVNMS